MKLIICQLYAKIMKISSPPNSLVHMRVLKIINDTEQRSENIMEKKWKKSHPCPLQAAFGRLPKGCGGLRPPPPFWSSVKDKDDLVFILFDIFLILFDFFPVTLIVFRTLMCAMLFWGYLFSLFSPIIDNLSISLFFNDFILYWGCVKLTTLAWRLMCWSPAPQQNHSWVFPW